MGAKKTQKRHPKLTSQVGCPEQVRTSCSVPLTWLEPKKVTYLSPFSDLREGLQESTLPKRHPQKPRATQIRTPKRDTRLAPKIDAQRDTRKNPRKTSGWTPKSCNQRTPKTPKKQNHLDPGATFPAVGGDGRLRHLPPQQRALPRPDRC